MVAMTGPCKQRKPGFQGMFCNFFSSSGPYTELDCVSPSSLGRYNKKRKAGLSEHVVGGIPCPVHLLLFYLATLNPISQGRANPRMHYPMKNLGHQRTREKAGIPWNLRPILSWKQRDQKSSLFQKQGLATHACHHRTLVA